MLGVCGGSWRGPRRKWSQAGEAELIALTVPAAWGAAGRGQAEGPAEAGPSQGSEGQAGQGRLTAQAWAFGQLRGRPAQG